MGRPLEGIRVIDLSHSWAAPHCGRILGDFGAEVIKVEYVRRLCLLRGARKENRLYDTHPGWLQVNRNKCSLTLDLKAEKDRDIFKDLVKISDVIIENSRTGVMEKLGFGYDDLREIRKDIIMLSMTAFGRTGPYASFAGYGAIMEAVGGIMSLTSYDKSVRPSRIRELDVTNGIAGACAVMTALIHREKTGKGQNIDLSQLEAATHGLIGEHLLELAMNGSQTLPLGNRHRKHAPQGCYRCKGEDRWVTLTVRTDDEWKGLCQAMKRSELAADPLFATPELRMSHHDILDALIEDWTLNHTHMEAMEILQRQRVPSGAVLDAGEVSSNEHLKERDYFMREEDGSAMTFMGMPFSLSMGNGTMMRRGPQLGQHNEYVVRKVLGRVADDVPTVRDDEIGTAFDPELE